MLGEWDFESCYRAVASRDARFDGWFVTAVTSTGIYCRPSCPAITPKRANVRFLPSAGAAQHDGFRACLRCRPDAAPGSPAWNYRADVIGRAMRLISDGVVDRDGVAGLAARLGYTSRHLGRLLLAEVGAGPLTLARAQRAQTARILIETTGLGLAEIAFASGFGSVRQFNDTIRDIYGRTPSTLRTTAGAHASAADAGTAPASPTIAGGAATVALRLAYREPLHTEALLDFLAARTVPGVDEVTDADAGGRTYRRALRLPHGRALAELSPGPGHIRAVLRLRDVRDLAPAVARCRRLFDLDADPVAVDAALTEDPALADAVRKEPGVRVPGAVDGFEIAVRAVVGQQISVRGARTVLGRLVAATAGVSGAAAEADTADDATDSADDVDGLAGFPTPEEIARAGDDAFAMPDARRRTLRVLAEAVADGTVRLDPGADRHETVARLCDIPGIGTWTATYVALRALGDPDVFLPTDLGVRRGARAHGLDDDPVVLAAYARDRWAPWRSYATIRLWRQA
jgi:AraC family transcriptional regulator of adaptative response / DNA-3-methyladenine glycosylase II